MSRRRTTVRRRVVIRRDATRARVCRPPSGRWPWGASLLSSLLLHAAAVAALALRTPGSANSDTPLYTVELDPARAGEARPFIEDRRSASVPPDQTTAPEDPARPGVSNYWSSVRAAVARQARYPAHALLRREEGVVLVRLTVDEDGRLADATALGDAPARLVESALDAVRRAAPFAPLTGLTHGAVSAVIPVRFAMENTEMARRRNPWME